MDINKLIEKGEIVVLPVIDKCKIFAKEVVVDRKPVMMEKGPCKRILSGKCEAYFNPTAKWKNGICPLASHIIYQEDEQAFKNPLKASKQASR